MKNYDFYLWIAYTSTATVLLINLVKPLIRYYKLLKKKRTICLSIFKK